MSKAKNIDESVKTAVKDLLIEIPGKMKENHIPGLAVAIVSKIGSIYCESCGYTDFSERDEVDENTLFCLQSTTKTITAVAFLLADQQGLARLDEPLIKYYPDFIVNSRFGEDQYKQITFRHLLSHSSGMAREARLGGVFNDTPCSWEEHIQSASGSWLKFRVGDGFSYSNIGLDLVAYALERITGKPYPEYVQEVLGDPLGITFHYDTKNVYNMRNSAKGYLGNSRALQVSPVGFGCGAAHLSVKDQAVFVRFLLNSGMIHGKQVLDARYVDEMRFVDKEGWYGLGTFVGREYGATMYYHPGGGFGLCSEMYWLPESDIGVVAFANQEYQQYLSALVKKSIRLILEAKGVASKATDFQFSNDPLMRIDTSSLERFEGIYRGVWGKASIKSDGGKLFLVYPNRRVELKPCNETVFSAESPKGVVFQLDGRGNPISLKMYSTDRGILHMDYLGRPPREHGSNRESWKEFVGSYRMTVYGTIRVSITVDVDRDGYLCMKGWSNERLYEHKSTPNLFFTFEGDAVIFEEDRLYFDNVEWRKVKKTR